MSYDGKETRTFARRAALLLMLISGSWVPSVCAVDDVPTAAASVTSNDDQARLFLRLNGRLSPTIAKQIVSNPRSTKVDRDLADLGPGVGQRQSDYSELLTTAHIDVQAVGNEQQSGEDRNEFEVDRSLVDELDVAQKVEEEPERLTTTITNPMAESFAGETASAMALPTVELPLDGELYPIDLATVLQLAGASNPQIKLARERVCEALARLKVAQVQWIPSLNVGVGYNHHDGRIQETTGRVLEVSRSSLFAGGGAVIDRAPVAGGSSGPLRLAVDLSLSDAFFDPLAARQNVRAVAAARNSRFNDILLQTVVAYLELSRAQSQMAIALNSENNARELLRLTQAQEKADVGLRADVERARTEVAARERQALVAEESLGVVSARLVQLLSLDPCLTLVIQDVHPVPLEIFSPNVCLGDLISQGIASRPERFEACARVQETYERQRQEDFRPWLPNVHVGYSGGTFAGGGGSFIGNNGSRGDLDVLAVWQLRNAGLGTQALRAGAASRHRQARLNECATRDQIAAEVSAAVHQVKSRRRQVDVTYRRVVAAAAALPLNFRGIVGRQLRAIEAQQAIQSLDDAFNGHLDAIVGFNQAQFHLLRAVGTPPDADSVACEIPAE